MPELIKTWPLAVGADAVARIFSPDKKKAPFGTLFFSLGPRKPKNLPITKLWFTYNGRILGHFVVDELVVNDGTLPRLNRIDGTEGEWQIRKDAWVALCKPPCVRLTERVFYSSFRGWHYFSLEEWKQNPESRHRI